MNSSSTVVRLTWLVAVLALASAISGLVWPGGGDQFSYTTLRGTAADIYGQGLYENDTLFIGAGNKGTDMVTILVGVPLLLIAGLLYRRRSLRGGLLLLGALPWFLYVGSSYALGAVAYNDLFLVYVALLSASLFAFVLAFRSLENRSAFSEFAVRLPRRGPAVFMFASAVVTLGVWLIQPLASLIGDDPPERLDTYTTLFTNALDIAIIVPTAFAAGVLILRPSAIGYLIALSLLVLEAMLAPMIVAQTISQVRAGVSFAPGEIVGPIVGFAILGVLAIWILVSILRRIPTSKQVSSAFLDTHSAEELVAH